ncbi:MAG TPA: nitrite/sulfite reductase [Dehalococcoidia bacterium]|nr:nitrite/sulfite reductase [Dehalococcoidia bacterium]
MQVQEKPRHKAHPKVPAELKPGRVFVTLDEEVENFQREARRFRADPEGTETDFTPFRLRQGIYGQRQMDQQMMRVKLPYGGVSADQMDAMAVVAEKYSGYRRGHITTRENFQFHFVNLDVVPEVLTLLQSVGLTTREACGHTVRNVTGCPYAGTCADEVFDATPYLAAYARQMLRNPICQNLPRKWKTAFSSCANDCAGTPFHDMGFIARVRREDGREVRGFEIVVGGGLSTMPRQADVVWEFARADNGEYIRVAEACLKVFDKEGGLANFLRKNMNKARVKFLVKQVGIEEFRRQVEEELAQPWAWEPLDMEALSQLAPEGPTAGEPPRNGHRPSADFERWRRTNVRAQRQPGYAAVTVTVPLGNLSPEQFHGLADVMRRYSGGTARTQQNQNLVLRWVREDALPALHADLSAQGLGAPDAGLIADTVACPGTDSCKMGITSSQGVGLALREAIESWDIDDPLVQQMTVKASGCPNGCGQHHLGAIGLQGSSFKAGLAEIPCYDIFLGGGNYIGGGKYGTRVARVPAKRLPQAVRKIIDHYLAERQDGEPFLDFVDRVGAKSFDPLLDEFKEVGAVHEEIETYMDWGKDEIFQVIRGEGECAV